VRVASLAAVLALIVGLSVSQAAPAQSPLEAQLDLLPRIDQAVRSSTAGDAEAMQERYDASRDLAESIRSANISSRCARLAQALTRVAEAEIAVSEAYDRLQGWQAKEPRAARARRSIEQARPSCRPGGASVLTAQNSTLALPGPGEAFFGIVTGNAPAGVAKVLVDIDGHRVGSATVQRGTFSTAVKAASGPAIVEALFVDVKGNKVGAVISRKTFLLPRSAANSSAPTRIDRTLSTQLAAIGLGFNGYAAIHLERFAAGTVAGWNDDAKFPAASTVKLAVMIEAAHRFGLQPSSPVLYDVEQAAGWSSNLAANRLLKLIGGGGVSKGVVVAESRLHTLGATSSTYPGEYRVGTSARGAPRQPPLTTQRVTTARDLSTVLRAIHLAAIGTRSGIEATGLSPAAARVMLRSLLQSQPVGDNIGLIRPFLPPNTPAAQKNGWISDSRATAAIIYLTDGPAIVVVMGFRSGGLSLAGAQQLGAKVVPLTTR
jgi:beta-lactamase class A